MEVESFTHAGLKVTIGTDEYTEHDDPRQYDNLGTMVCWHPDYVLGDYQVTNEDGRGAVKDRFQRDDFRGLDVLERYLRLVASAVVTVPLYLYDHSGISMSAGAPNPFDNPRVRSDHHGAGMGWDTSMVGYIYTTRERILELCGEPQLETDPFYCPRTWPEDGRSGPNWPRERTAVEWIAKQLAIEVDVYDQWLRGEVYYYVVEDEKGETLDSCGGFIGGGVDKDGRELDGLGYVTLEAREAAEGCRELIDRRRRETLAGWAWARGGRGEAMPV